MEMDDRPNLKKSMVKKRDGRVEPFDIGKMTRAISRAGIPFVMAKDISTAISNKIQHRNSELEYDLPDQDIIPSSRLRELVASELMHRNQPAIAESYSGYNKGDVGTLRRTDKFDSKVYQSDNTSAKQFAKDKDIKSARGSKIAPQ
jgi:transcriptional repressor NrdR